MNCLEEIFSKKIIVKGEENISTSQETAEEKALIKERIFLEGSQFYYYIKENEGKAFTVQALFNRINEWRLDEQLKSNINLGMIEEILKNLEKKGKISSEQRGSEKFYFIR